MVAGVVVVVEVRVVGAELVVIVEAESPHGGIVPRGKSLNEEPLLNSLHHTELD
jgi:hypothetical protein